MSFIPATFSATETVQPKRKVSPLDTPGVKLEQKGHIRPDDLQIFIGEKTLRDIINYSKTDLWREVGGVLVGGYFIWCGVHYVEIDTMIPARYGESRVGAFKFTHEAWADIHDRLDAEFPEKQIVGWYHTHPNLGVFLSEDDRFIHQHFFSQPWQIALVVDPIAHQLAFFQWRNRDVDPCGFFFVRGEPTTETTESEVSVVSTTASESPDDNDKVGGERVNPSTIDH